MLILALIVVSLFLIFGIVGRNAGAQDPEDAQITGDFTQMLENQKNILEKLDSLDRKLDVIRMRISL
jgi:hypothetical protein